MAGAWREIERERTQQQMDRRDGERWWMCWTPAAAPDCDAKRVLQREMLNCTAPVTLDYRVDWYNVMERQRRPVFREKGSPSPSSVAVAESIYFCTSRDQR